MNINTKQNIRLKDIQQMLDCTVSTASKKKALVRDALGKPKPQIITVREFITYYGIEL